MADKPANDSLWNWLGRQIGHVKHAVTVDVTKPAAPAAEQPAVAPEPTPAPAVEAPKVIYRDEKAEEIDLPDRPGVKLRRTVIDEVIVDETKDKGDSSQ